MTMFVVFQVTIFLIIKNVSSNCFEIFPKQSEKNHPSPSKPDLRCGFNLSSTPSLFLQEIQMKGPSRNLEVCENEGPMCIDMPPTG